MSWFKVSDGFHASRKVKSIPPRQRLAAIGLWTIAGSWCSQELTDGHVPDYMIREWGPSPKALDALIESGLWIKVRGGFAFSSWLEFNPSKARVEDERAASKERMQASRERRRAKSAGKDVDKADVAAQQGRNGHDVLRRPDPTRPDHKEKNSYPDAFEAWWQAYPRKESKGDALKAWVAARERATDDQLIAGAKRYDALPDRDPKFTKLAGTWLRADCWLDGVVTELHDPADVIRDSWRAGNVGEIRNRCRYLDIPDIRWDEKPDDLDGDEFRKQFWRNWIEQNRATIEQALKGAS